jgi:toxin FitB
MKYLLDTNVFREIGRTTPHEHVSAWLAQVDDADLAISTLTVREVMKGVSKLRPRKPEVAAAIQERIQMSFEALSERVLPVSREIVELWGTLLGESDKHVDDTGIAATARVHGLILVTRNVSDMLGRGAVILDPFKKSPKVERP